MLVKILLLLILFSSSFLYGGPTKIWCGDEENLSIGETRKVYLSSIEYTKIDENFCLVKVKNSLVPPFTVIPFNIEEKDSEEVEDDRY